MNTSLLPAHGGCGLIDRFVSGAEINRFKRDAARYKTHIINEADLSVFYRIADGTLSPLEGPMGKDEFYGVLDREFIERNNKKYAWTIPIALPVSKQEGELFSSDEIIALKTEQDKLIGFLEISDIYPFDRDRYNKAVYGTGRRDHPGPRIVNDDPRDYLLGGKIFALPCLPDDNYGNNVLGPQECRNLFAQKRWERIVAFQTRNPLHRAHEYAMVYAMEKLTREGFLAGVVLNPLVGPTKSDDVPALVRMQTYEALIENRLFGLGDKDEVLWKNKEYDLADNIILIAIDMKMFYAGPKEAIMHAIYRQNCGFTDIIIGRKHADAPFDDGTPAWSDFAAQEKFCNLPGELLIQPLNVGFAAYFDEIKQVGFVEEFKDKGFTEITISGKALRQKLQSGEPIDERIMRKPVADILQQSYRNNVGALREEIKSSNITWSNPGISKEDLIKRNGYKGAVIWLTGLSGAGKSTIAAGVRDALSKKGCNVFVLDGDNVRHGLNKDLGFSPRDREENIRRIAEVAKLFCEAGFIIITAFISPYIKDRRNARSLLARGDFVEVHVKAGLAACEARDPKGLYKKARAGQIGEFTGINAPYEEPVNPELIVDTESLNITESVQSVLSYLTDTGLFL
ncbi:MAG: adenylyl-sulfate kinase [Candidatus Omnitrophota bacterium]